MATGTAASNSDVYSQAAAYLRAGLSVLPILTDGTKAPAVPSWTPYQGQLPTLNEIEEWFAGDNPPGVAVIGGRVSGHLELIDFDNQADTIFPLWCELVEAERPGLLERLNVVKTPRRPAGYHVRYRCPEVEIPGNTKLAVDPSLPKQQRTLIETRGEGGYGLAPGCPPQCHENNACYEHYRGPRLPQVQEITAQEREVLIRCSCSFNKETEGDPREKGQKARTGLSPGDDFNARGPGWAELLEPHGWVAARVAGGVTYWRRPGKEKGWSATTGKCTSKAGHELFACFSENAEPFQGASGGKPCTTYSKFAVFTYLNHGGDFSAAARELARQGYGDRPAGGKRDKKGAAGAGEKDSEGVEAGPLRLRAGTPRRTESGKLSVPVTVIKGGQAVDHIQLTSTAHGRKEAVRLLTAHAGEESRDAVERAVSAVLADAARRVEQAPGVGKPSLYSLVFDLATRAFRFAYRTPDGGLFSEARQRPVSRQEFLAWTPLPLCEEVAKMAGEGADPLAQLPLIRPARPSLMTSPPPRLASARRSSGCGPTRPCWSPCRSAPRPTGRWRAGGFPWPAGWPPRERSSPSWAGAAGRRCSPVTRPGGGSTWTKAARSAPCWPSTTPWPTRCACPCPTFTTRSPSPPWASGWVSGIRPPRAYPPAPRGARNASASWPGRSPRNCWTTRPCGRRIQ
jgi:hypothetical protein